MKEDKRYPIDQIKTDYHKGFFKGYLSGFDDLKNTLNNVLFEITENPIDLIFETNKDNSVNIRYNEAEYEALSTTDKLKFEFFVEIAQKIIDTTQSGVQTEYDAIIDCEEFEEDEEDGNK